LQQIHHDANCTKSGVFAAKHSTFSERRQGQGAAKIQALHSARLTLRGRAWPLHQNPKPSAVSSAEPDLLGICGYRFTLLNSVKSRFRL
jgi:hypothetical protein